MKTPTAIMACLTAIAAAAQYHRAPPRLSRAVPDSVVLHTATNNPVGSITLPRWRIQPWRAKPWKTGEAAKYHGAIYICVQSHTALADWQPDIVPALWRLVRAPGEAPNDIPEWRQPQGAHDAYQVGDRVKYNGSIWRNTYPFNPYKPGEYGWEIIE